MSKRRLSSDHACMKNISAEVSMFCLWTNWRHLVTFRKIEFCELFYCSRCALDKICEIYTFDRCPHGCTGQKPFLTCGDAKKENWRTTKFFLKMCPKPFSWAKNKRKIFSVGKSRGPLLARVALKLSNHKIMNHKPVIYLIECASCVLVYFCFDGRLCSLIQSANNHLLLPSINECWNSKYALNFKSLETLIQSLNKDFTF